MARPLLLLAVLIACITTGCKKSPIGAECSGAMGCAEGTERCFRWQGSLGNPLILSRKRARARLCTDETSWPCAPRSSPKLDTLGISPQATGAAAGHELGLVDRAVAPHRPQHARQATLSKELRATVTWREDATLLLHRSGLVLVELEAI
jgi:hypothetical protein